MKKTLLIGTALLFCAAGFAQNNRKGIFNMPVAVSVKDHNKAIDAPIIVSGPTTTKPVTTPVQKNNSACGSQKFTTCVNAFAVCGGITTNMQNCLSYNKDLNTVLWTSRMSALWPVAGTGLTNTGPGTGTYGGCIQSTWLNLTTNTWDSMIIYRDSNFAAVGDPRARFPGGVIFNPTGNTSISGAYMAGSGAYTTPAAVWGGTWYSTRKAGGNYHAVTSAQEHNNFCLAGAAPFGNIGNSATNLGFLNVDMQQVGQNILVAGALHDPAGHVQGAVIGKGAYSGGTFTWSADSSLKPPFYTSTAAGTMNDAEGARIAFDKNGQIGYAVFVGRLATNYNNSADSMMMPIVYKTTNGGTSWTLVLAGYDWSKAHPELTKNVGAWHLYGTTKAPRHFTPYLQHGNDLTVDTYGTLHFVTTLTMPYKDGGCAGVSADSLQYTYSFKWDYINTHPVVWDLMTDGTCWKTLMVDSIQSSYMSATDTTSSYGSWEGQTTGSHTAYGAHMTVSRSSDGTKIFYGWCDTDYSLSPTHFNNQPDVFVKGFDVVNNKLTTISNITFAGTCFFPYMSDISYYDNTLNKWVAPFVYTSGNPAYDVTAGILHSSIKPVDFYYNDCAKYAASSFSITAVPNADLITTACAVGVKTNNNFVNSVSNYPNPFNNSTNIVVNLNEGKTINLQIYDAVGKLVFSKNTNGNIGENTIVFDATNLNAGVYYYTVTAGYDKVSKKMVIQK